MKNLSYPVQFYPAPKKGIFNVPSKTNEYTFPEGWAQDQEEIEIIGESKIAYVYKIIETEHGFYEGEKVIKKKYLLPIGVHKSRLVRWVSGQLTLFQ